MNKKVTVTAPKDNTFCTTMSLTGRVHFVAIRDSVGDVEAVTSVLKTIGFDSLPSSTLEHLRRTDNFNRYQTDMRQKPEVKVKRNLAKTENLRQEMQKQEKDRRRGLTYESNIALCEDGGLAVSAAEPIVVPPTAAKEAKACKCGSFSHKRTSHRDCSWKKT